MTESVALPVPRQEWAGPDGEIGRFVHEANGQCLDAYRANPRLVIEHANIERAIAQGGYQRRQIYELVQNAADALISFPQGHVEVILTKAALYCANQGAPLTVDGADALLSSHVSMKRGSEIGRFGLGFKSLLEVSDGPEFYSRTGSFRFLKFAAEKHIRDIVPEAERTPILRLAFPVKAADQARGDSVLAELMKWAATVVKVPLDHTKAGWLAEDIEGFPAPFLLFSSHVGSVTLLDRAYGSIRREISLTSRNESIVLKTDTHKRGENAASESEWKVFETQYCPSERARQEAGELANRESLPLVWAVPTRGREMTARGTFWAFFPTEYYTTLSGIVNAPWKTNEDRQNLLRDSFNEEMVHAAAELVVASLPHLSDHDDPGRFLELLPARGREAPNWADAALTQHVYDTAASAASLPDQDGVLRRPVELNLQPPTASRQAAEVWAGHIGRPRDWCHPSVEMRERRPRAERILEAGGGFQCRSLVPWLEALVSDKTAAGSLIALRTAATVREEKPDDLEIRRQIESACIVLTAEGELVAPRPGTVFLPDPSQVDLSNVTLIHPAVAGSAEGRAAMLALGITEADAGSQLESMVASPDFSKSDRHYWETVWSLVRSMSREDAVELLKKHGADDSSVRVRTVSGEFRPICQTLLPGPVVPKDGSRDSGATVDIAYHEREAGVLADLGSVSVPTPGRGSPSGTWYDDYRAEAISSYYAALPPRSSRPSPDHLRLRVETSIGPLDPIYDLCPDGRARFTEELLRVSGDSRSAILSHSTRTDHYPALRFPAPAIWLAHRHGCLITSRGIQQLDSCVGPALSRWREVLPVVTCDAEVAATAQLPMREDDLTGEQWIAGLEAALEIDHEWDFGDFYAAAARHVPAPETISCRARGRVVRRSPRAVMVVAGADEARAFDDDDTPMLLVSTSDQAEALQDQWGLRPVDQFLTKRIVAVQNGPTRVLSDMFPLLGTLLEDAQRETTLTSCSSLRLEMFKANGKTNAEKEFIGAADTIYYSEHLQNEDLLDRLLNYFDANISWDTRERILKNLESQAAIEFLTRVRAQPDSPRRLLAAVGSETLRQRLPIGLLEAAKSRFGSVTDERAAELVLAVYGVETLQLFKDELRQKGLEVPSVWAGSHTARTFVERLGFAREYAGFPGARRDPVIEVEGHPNLQPLHPFQETITERIRALVDRRGQPARALLSLPTGAGKTRVTVQSFIDAMRDGLGGPVLWIAQSDELCEQAVQTWIDVWRALGEQRRLQINRLWANNDADPAQDMLQVVVATVQKLGGCVDDPLYDWLSRSSVVVVDEAHSSTETSYTKVLHWLGLGRSSARDRCPLIGLTATAFRTSEEGTRRLVNRYGKTRLDDGVLGDDPYRTLQDMGVLSWVDHELLRGAELEAAPAELERLHQFDRRLPDSLAERIGQDVPRNEMLLESMLSRPADWPILLFAASVDHAQTMAALLTAEGVPSAAVSAATEPRARRHYIEQFRAGGLRVLTNYQVLTEGFDAPSVRAVYVARPTYSPNLYQQMIGRGLRGPLNGGKERCLIVNVEDNIRNYGQELAFRQFEYLWSEV